MAENAKLKANLVRLILLVSYVRLKLYMRISNTIIILRVE